MVNSLGGDTKEAAKLADQAIIDMSDNANKMGTDLASIQNAYQGFAKQNYTMLDNLKLGYGGTKTEMERLIADANEFREASGRAGDLTIEKYSDVVTAIHEVQTQLGITGTTAAEAADTIQGAAGAAQAAWENLVAGLADPAADLDRLINDFILSKTTEIENMLPTIEHTVEGIAQAMDTLFAEIADSDSAVSEAIGKVEELSEEILETIAENLLKAAPLLIDGALSMAETLVTGIADGIDDYLPVIIDMVGRIASTIVGHTADIVDAGMKLVIALIDGIITNLPKLLVEVAVVVGEIAGQLVKTLVEMQDDFDKIGGDLFAYVRDGIYNAIEETDWTEISKRIADNWLDIDFENMTDFKKIGAKMFDAIVNGLNAAANFGLISAPTGLNVAGTLAEQLTALMFGGDGEAENAITKRTEEIEDEVETATQHYVETVDRAAKKQEEAYKSFLKSTTLDTSDEALKNQEKMWDELFHYDKKSQEDYWQARYEYLDTHRSNTEAWWNAWNETEKHFADKAAKEQKDAEDARAKAQKASEEAAKKAADAQKKSIEDAFKELEIQSADEGKGKEWLLKQQRAYIDTLDKSSELYRTYDQKWRKDWADWQKKQRDEEEKQRQAAEKQAQKDTDNWVKYAEKRADAQQKAVEKIEQAERNTADAYNRQMQDFTRMTDANGEERLIIADVKEKIKELETYEKNIEKLKGMGLPDGMLDDILSMNFDERALYVKELLRMSERQRSNYFGDYTRYRETAQRVAHTQYEDDYAQAAKDAADATADIWSQMPDTATEEGRKAAKAYIDAYTGYMRENGYITDAAVSASNAVGMAYSAKAAANQTIGGNLTINVAGKLAIATTLKEIFASMKNSGAVIDV